MKILLIDALECSGCRRCELACSYAKESLFNYALSRIRLLRLSDLVSNIPMVCQQCDTPLCTFACPTGAISQDKETGVVTINEGICVGCLMCFLACPLGGIVVTPQSKIPSKCDLCAGEPQCVRECEYGALEYVTIDEANATKRRKAARELPRLLELVAPSR